jgi:hypothetical protein
MGSLNSRMGVSSLTCVTEKRGDGEPMHLRACVSEEGADGEGAGSQALSDTLRYINLAGLATGLVKLRGPMHLCACVSEECEDGEGAGSQALTDTLRYINLAGLATGLC